MEPKTFTVNCMVLRIFQFSDLAASFNLGTPMETKLAQFSRISDPSLPCTRANGHLLHLMVRAGFKTSRYCSSRIGANSTSRRRAFIGIAFGRDIILAKRNCLSSDIIFDCLDNNHSQEGIDQFGKLRSKQLNNRPQGTRKCGYLAGLNGLGQSTKQFKH